MDTVMGEKTNPLLSEYYISEDQEKTNPSAANPKPKAQGQC